MMNYESFKKEVSERFLEFFPETYQNAEVKILPTNKTNCVLDGLHIKLSESGIYPVIYVNDMYEEYCSNTKVPDFDAVVRKYADSYIDSIKQVGQRTAESLNITNPNYAKDRVFFYVVNTEQNREMVMGMPHREFKDLSIVYRILVREDKDGIASAPVTNALAGKLGFDEAELFKLAAKNTRILFPPVMNTIEEMLKEDFIRKGIPEEIIEAVFYNSFPIATDMYVIGNRRGLYGAAVMLYEDVLHKLATQLDSDLYILPSSVNEVIAISTDNISPDELAGLAEMVSTINLESVETEQRLSNQVYLYDRCLRRVSLATDTSNKFLI